jgi:hypothetical protein
VRERTQSDGREKREVGISRSAIEGAQRAARWQRLEAEVGVRV